MQITKAINKDVIDMEHPAHKRHVYESLLKNSYAIIKNHSVDLNKLDQLYQEWELFFAKSIAEKTQYIYSLHTDDGYVPINIEHAKDRVKPDPKEFYQIHLQGLLNSKTPCSILTKKIFYDLTNLGEYVIKIIDEYLPKEIKHTMQLWQSVENSRQHCMRFIHYPPCGSSKKLYRSAPHNDICLLTIILPSRGEGLLMKKNNGWAQEDSTPQSLVIFNSEMIEIGTRGYLKSMMHQVKTDLTENFSYTSRYSMPFFVHPHSNTLLEKNLTASYAVKKRIIEIGLDKVSHSNPLTAA